MIADSSGSGSFSHSIIRTIAPIGHLYTFEYHEERAAKALEEFKTHGLSDFVTVEHRNVCKDGFGDVDSVDAGMIYDQILICSLFRFTIALDGYSVCKKSFQSSESGSYLWIQSLH